MNSIAILIIVIVILSVMLISAFEDKKEYCNIIQNQKQQIEAYEKLIYEKEEF